MIDPNSPKTQLELNLIEEPKSILPISEIPLNSVWTALGYQGEYPRSFIKVVDNITYNDVGDVVVQYISSRDSLIGDPYRIDSFKLQYRYSMLKTSEYSEWIKSA